MTGNQREKCLASTRSAALLRTVRFLKCLLPEKPVRDIHHFGTGRDGVLECQPTQLFSFPQPSARASGFENGDQREEFLAALGTHFQVLGHPH